jgi:hypothetical protein
MTETKQHQFGFRIVGDCRSERRIVDAKAAMTGYARCDERAEVDSSETVRGYSGSCFGEWLWWDIDFDGNLPAARVAALILARYLIDRYQLDDDGVLIFFSGSKGFHVGVPVSLLNADPSDDFHRVAKRFAIAASASLQINVDSGVYDRVRAFRAPNSRHPKSGLYKRRIVFSQLQRMELPAVLELAKSPEGFELPEDPDIHPQASKDWQDAVKAVAQATSETQQMQDTADGPRLNRLTLDFMQAGASKGDRHRTLYSAARNIGDFACTAELAHALLTDAGLDVGLPPGEVYRQIECGLKDSNYGLRTISELQGSK